MTDESLLSRSERLLALLLVQGKTGTQQEKIVMLKRAGVGNTDIAELVGTTPSSVSTSLNLAKKAKPTKKPAAKTAKKGGR